MVTDFFRQLDVFAQGDMEGWVDLLVLVAMAVFWALAGLRRAGAKKRQQSPGVQVPADQQGRRQENWQQRLARKAQEMQRAIEAKGRESTERVRQVGEPRPVRRPAAEQPRPGRITIRPTPAGESVLVYEQAEPSAGTVRQQQAARQREAKEAVSAAMRAGKVPPPVQARVEAGGPGSEPVIESMTSVASEPSTPLDLSREELVIPHGPTGYEPGSIIDATDRDALKKAILHYEILGKPVALRDPFEQMGLA